MTAKARVLVLVVGVAVLAAGAALPAAAQEAAGGAAPSAAPLPPSDAAGGGGAADPPPQGVMKAAEEVPSVKVAGKEGLTVSGFLSATFFAQDQNFSFGNGQNAEWPTSSYESNKWFNGGDVRNTRLTLAFNGPQSADGWKVGAMVEADFFGGFNGTGAFSQEQAVPRIRLAYADLTKGSTTLRIGQFWSPLFGETAASLSHIAFPLGYGSAGDVGWRFPGFFLYQGLSSPEAKVKSQLVVAIFEGSWDGPGSPIANLSAGNVGFRNQVEARLNLGGKSGGGNPWSVYVVGHWDDKDLTGVGDTNPDGSHGSKSLTGTAAEVGGSYKIGSFLIHGNLYTSKAAGQQFTDITQFGDIKDTGGWLQLGYDLSQRWSIYGFYGMVDANKDDVLKWVGDTGRIKNQQAVFMVQWSLGQYQLGLEWLHDQVTNAAEVKTKGNEIALSTKYVF